MEGHIPARRVASMPSASPERPSAFHRSRRATWPRARGARGLGGAPGGPGGGAAGRVVVNGWHGDVGPLSASLDFARARSAALHIVDDGHRLADSLDLIGALFQRQLERALGHR